MRLPRNRRALLVATLSMLALSAAGVASAAAAPTETASVLASPLSAVGSQPCKLTKTDDIGTPLKITAHLSCNLKYKQLKVGIILYTAGPNTSMDKVYQRSNIVKLAGKPCNASKGCEVVLTYPADYTKTNCVEIQGTYERPQGVLSVPTQKYCVGSSWTGSPSATAAAPAPPPGRNGTGGASPSTPPPPPLRASTGGASPGTLAQPAREHAGAAAAPSGGHGGLLGGGGSSPISGGGG